MEKQKKIRLKIAGHRQHIQDHERKIESELHKPTPNQRLIELWKKQIANAQDQIEKPERRMR